MVCFLPVERSSLEPPRGVSGGRRERRVISLSSLCGKRPAWLWTAARAGGRTYASNSFGFEQSSMEDSASRTFEVRSTVFASTSVNSPMSARVSRRRESRHAIRRLEVPVDDPLRMGGGEPLSGGEEERHHVRPSARGGAKPDPEVAAFDELHHHDDLTRPGEDVVDGHHVGMAQLGKGLRLPHQAGMLGSARGRVVNRLPHQDVEGNTAIQLLVVGGIDGPIPPSPSLSNTRKRPMSSPRGSVLASDSEVGALIVALESLSEDSGGVCGNNRCTALAVPYGAGRKRTRRAVVLDRPGPIRVGLDLQPGQTLLVRDGTSSTGLAAAGVAKKIGAVVFATTRDPSRAAVLEELGAIALVDDGNVAAQVQARYPAGVDAALERVGTPTLPSTLRATRTHGTVCFAGMLSNEWRVKLLCLIAR